MTIQKHHVDSAPMLPVVTNPRNGRCLWPRCLGQHIATMVLALCVMTTVANADNEPQNQIFSRLTEQGIYISSDVTVPLPAPFLADGLDAAVQKERVTQIAGRYGVARFARDSAVAPFVLQQRYIKDAEGQRLGHAIDLCFVVYGTLADLQRPELARGFFNPESSGKQATGTSFRELEAGELVSVSLDKKLSDSEKYIQLEAPIMNRVFVSGIGHVERSQSVESLLIAWEIDSRFNDHSDLANRWWPIETTDLGTRQRGSPQTYHGYGGYVKITTLLEPAGAMLCEAHVVFHEPTGWFQGSNALRSKTWMVAEENVDKLRRRLARIE